MIIGLVGEPGAGKTTIAKQLAEKDPGTLVVIHVSELLTEEHRKSVLGPERLTRSLVWGAIVASETRHVLIDSAPRSLGQLFWLYSLQSEMIDSQFKMVAVCPPHDVVLRRIVDRGRDEEFHWLNRLIQYDREKRQIRRYQPSDTLVVSGVDTEGDVERIWEWITGLE